MKGPFAGCDPHSAMNCTQQHVRIGMKPGFIYAREQCKMAMNFLNWSYEFLFNDIYGHLNESDIGASTGLTGDLLTGRVDMICHHVQISTTNSRAYDYTYPTQISDLDVYIYHNSAEPIRQYASIGRPFTQKLWFLVLLSGIVTVTVFSAMQAVVVRSFTSPRSFKWWTELTTGIKFGISKKFLSQFASVKLASALWLILWGPVILQLYQANLKFYLTVPDRVEIPFLNFEELLLQLRTGTYRLLIGQDQSMPSCPVAYGNNDDCKKIFAEILNAHPALHYTDSERVADQPGNIVTVLSIPAALVPAKVSLFVDDELFRSNVLAVRNDQISNPHAGFPLRKSFEHRALLNNAIISLQSALQTVGRFNMGQTLIPARFDWKPERSAFTLLQLTSAFKFLALGLGLAFCCFLVELCLLTLKKCLCSSTAD